MITEEMKKKASIVLRHADVTRAAIFGSFARGDATDESDLDLLIEFKGEKTLLNLVALKVQLEKALGKKVDLLTYQSLSPLLRGIILREQVPLL